MSKKSLCDEMCAAAFQLAEQAETMASHNMGVAALSELALQRLALSLKVNADRVRDLVLQVHK